jgi:hypothetical protein
MYDARGFTTCAVTQKQGFRPTPLTDGFEIIRAEVRDHRIFATFGTPNPLKLQAQQSYFPLISNLRAITLRLYEKPPSGAFRARHGDGAGLVVCDLAFGASRPR